MGNQGIQATGLRVDAQMLQCIQHEHSETHKDKAGGGSTTITTYTYSVEWAPKYVNSQDFDPKGLSSSNFRMNCGIHNPQWPMDLPENRELYAPQMKVGGFTTSLTDRVPVD